VRMLLLLRQGWQYLGFRAGVEFWRGVNPLKDHGRHPTPSCISTDKCIAGRWVLRGPSSGFDTWTAGES